MIVGKSRCRTRPPSQDYSTECSFSASSQRRLWFLCMWNTKMPTVAILGTRKLHYESKQEIDVVSKKVVRYLPRWPYPKSLLSTC